MADIYSTEPLCSGKVCLVTSVGDIDIELWTREAPVTCKSFLQHCLDGYYDGMIFHRVIKDFMAQTGCPLGNGEGGEGAYEKTFRDEFHSRLRFNRRGLLGMANGGKDDNASQFFLTLDATNDLNKKHTMFGKVTGPTMFNMLRLNELDYEEGENEKPKMPPFIKRTEVLNLGIFEDLKPRELEIRFNPVTGKRENIEIANKMREEKKKKKSKSRAVKNFGLLSFGAEAESDEEKEQNNKSLVKNKSIYEQKKPEVNEKSEKSGKPRKVSFSADNGNSAENGNPENSNRNTDAPFTKEDNLEMVANELPKEDFTDEAVNNAKLEKEKIKEAKKQAKIDAKKKKKGHNPMLEALHKEQTEYRAKSKTSIPKKGKKRETSTMQMLNGFSSKMIEQGRGVTKFGKKAEDYKGDDYEEKCEELKLLLNTTKKKVEKKVQVGHELDEELPENSDSGDEDPSSIWGHRFKKAESEDELDKASDAKKLGTDCKIAKDATMGKSETTFDIHDPRNTINKRRREAASKKGNKKARIMASSFGSAI